MFTYVVLFLSTDSQSPCHSKERKGGRQRLQLTAMLLTQAVQYGSVADRKYFSTGGFSAAFKVEQYPLYNNCLSIIRRTLSVHLIIITLTAYELLCRCHSYKCEVSLNRTFKGLSIVTHPNQTGSMFD